MTRNKYLYLRPNTNKPNFYKGNQEKRCPFCEPNYTDLVHNMNNQFLGKHEEEDFLWIKNLYPTLIDMDLTLMLLSKDCDVNVDNMEIHKIQKLIDYTLTCAKEMKEKEGYKDVIIFQNYGPQSGGSVPHAHFQINGVKNKEIEPKTDVSLYQGVLIDVSDDKKSTLTVSDKPMTELIEFNISWEGNHMSKEAALYLKQITQFTHVYKDKPMDYNLVFHYDEQTNRHYIKVILRQPVTIYYLAFGLHVTLENISVIIDKFNQFKTNSFKDRPLI